MLHCLDVQSVKGSLGGIDIELEWVGYYLVHVLHVKEVMVVIMIACWEKSQKEYYLDFHRSVTFRVKERWAFGVRFRVANYNLSQLMSQLKIDIQSRYLILSLKTCFVILETIHFVSHFPLLNVHFDLKFQFYYLLY